MHHSNFQHAFFQQRFYILIKKEHRIKTPHRRSMGGGRKSREKATLGCFSSSVVWTKGTYTEQSYEIIQDISGTQNKPDMMMARNLTVTWISKFPQYFSLSFTANFSEQLKCSLFPNRFFSSLPSLVARSRNTSLPAHYSHQQVLWKKYTISHWDHLLNNLSRSRTHHLKRSHGALWNKLSSLLSTETVVNYIWHSSLNTCKPSSPLL